MDRQIASFLDFLYKVVQKIKLWYSLSAGWKEIALMKMMKAVWENAFMLQSERKCVCGNGPRVFPHDYRFLWSLLLTFITWRWRSAPSRSWPRVKEFLLSWVGCWGKMVDVEMYNILLWIQFVIRIEKGRKRIVRLATLPCHHHHHRWNIREIDYFGLHDAVV